MFISDRLSTFLTKPAGKRTIVQRSHNVSSNIIRHMCTAWLVNLEDPVVL